MANTKITAVNIRTIHLILPDGTRIDGDTYTINAEHNVKYVFKAYDLAGNDKLHNFDFKLNGGIAHKKDVYKATIKFEVNQK